MNHEILLPSIAERNADVFVSLWLKVVGDHVVAGEPVLEVMTDKTSFEIESPATGTLAEISAFEEDRIEEGQILGIVES